MNCAFECEKFRWVFKRFDFVVWVVQRHGNDMIASEIGAALIFS